MSATEHKIKINSDFSYTVLQKSFSKAGANSGKVAVDLRELRTKLSSIFSDNLSVYAAVYRDLKAQKKYTKTNNKEIEVEINKTPAYTLLRLLYYLTGSGDVPTKKDATFNLFIEHIRVLINTGGISGESELKIVNAQLALLGADEYRPVTWTHFFICYFSLGNKPPDAALLCYDVNSVSQAVQLTFARPHSIHQGMVRRNDAGIYIQLDQLSNKTPSLLSIKSDKQTGTLADGGQFEGYYCSALDYGAGGPVVGKLILTRVQTEAVANRVINETGEKANIPDNIYHRLINQRLNTTSVDAASTLPVAAYVGVYRAYWFLAKSGYQEIRQIRIEIEANGIVTLIDTDTPTNGVKGLATKTAVDSTILRLNLDYKEQSGYRLNIAIDVKNTSNNYFDGIYSGLRPNTETLMAGKIRLYKDSNFNANEVAGYIISANSEERQHNQKPFASLTNGSDILDFFLGKKKAGSTFIQPAYSVYRNILLPNKADNSVHKQVKKWAGSFCLYRLDSGKKRINLYWLTLDKDGSFHYTLTETSSAEPITYSGKASFVNGSLIFQIRQKDKDNHIGLFIFRIGGARRDNSVRFVSGVYATLSAISDAPLCGRAVLVPEVETRNVVPINIGEDAFYETDKATGGLMQRLIGSADNMIEAPGEINKRGRFIPYGTVFFAYSCELAEKYGQLHLQKDASFEQLRGSCLKSLRMAIEHGFSDVSLLREYLENGRLTAISKFVTLETDEGHQNRHRITLQFQEDEKPITMRFRTRN